MRNIMKKARILLVDQDNMFRLWVRHMLEQEEDMEIVGDCTSAEEALSQIDVLSPNIILMDTWLPGMDGIEACRHLTGNGYSCDVIMLSNDQEQVYFALSAGTTYYFHKDIGQRELSAAIRLIGKWQSIKAESDSSVYSICQIEAMLMDNLTKFTVEEEIDEGSLLGKLPAEASSLNKVRDLALVIPIPHDVSQLQRFICQVAETLQTSTLETAGSWDETHLTLKLRKPASRTAILEKLIKMPEVEKVEEKELLTTGRFKFFQKTKPAIQKEISITLSAQAPLATFSEPLQYLEQAKPQPQLVGSMVS